MTYADLESEARRLDHEKDRKRLVVLLRKMRRKERKARQLMDYETWVEYVRFQQEQGRGKGVK